MAKPPITRYTVDALVNARKYAVRVKKNTLESKDPKHGELLMLFEIRRVDSPAVDLVLEFRGRVMKAALPGVASTLYPSASLIWYGQRIRCLDHKIVHDVKEDGIVCGRIKGWHEHFWTDADGDDAVRPADPPVKNCDLHAIIAWCSKKWNIEGIQERGGLFDE
jgi:hypothetical protein